MKCEHLHWDAATGWVALQPVDHEPALVIYFGVRQSLAVPDLHGSLASRFPKARIIGCSTGGQIVGDDVTDRGAHAVAVSFRSTRIELASASVAQCSDSFVCGAGMGLELARAQRPDSPLAGVFVLSDGLMVNGSRLAAGLSSAVGAHVPVSGGLAGDGPLFQETWVAADAPPAKGVIAAVGLYGSEIRLGHGSAGGWDVFGPRRRITRSTGNVLFELDGQPALDLYERYLGPEEYALLPGSALLFPLMLRNPEAEDHDVVRTVLAVDRDRRTMTFAGDVPQGWTAQLMRGQFERLSQAAMQAAEQASAGIGPDADGDSVAILVSCIGRRLLMGQHIGDEVDGAIGGLGRKTGLLGFYSYGEIAPHRSSGLSQLHNQTMTITTLREQAA